MEMNCNRIALALAFAALLIVFGCTSSKYVACCVKDKIYNSTSGQLLASPTCRFQNDTLFGSCSMTLGLFNSGVANCTDTAGTDCRTITNADDCDITTTCHWNESASPKCQGGDAYWLKPICVDDIPKSCVNNRCTAMMCGFSDLAPSPPPSSQDWDIENFDSSNQKQVPNSEAAAPLKVNLQGTSCAFEPMSKKLYKTVQNSKGSLWVNAFRFGVGRSFGDYESSRYFFPATDYLCNINPKGTKDRFSVYLNEPSALCGNVSSYYECGLNHLNFTDATICRAYCDGDASQCTAKAGTQYACQSTKFAYSTKEACKETCSVLSDPSLCTSNNVVAPFLQSDARYKMKYVADYYTSSGQISGDEDDPLWATCRYGPWRVESDSSTGPWCNDFYPWQAWTENGDGGSIRPFYESRKSPQLEFDYDYYAKQLTQQYLDAGYDPDDTYPFECESSVECMSGSCDQAHYSRGLCTGASGTIDCGCNVESVGQSLTPTLVCPNVYSPHGMVAKTSQSPARAPASQKIAKDVNEQMFLPEHEYSRGLTSVNFQYYYQENDADPSAQPKLFAACGVAPNATKVKKCVYTAQFYTGQTYNGTAWVDSYSTPYRVITDLNGSSCPRLPNGKSNPAQPANYSFYDINLTRGQAKLGNCELDPDKMVVKPETPYFNITQRGWCAACTYSTLAVQKISAGAPGGPTVDGTGQGSFGGEGSTCLHWRGERDYDSATGPGSSLRDADADGRADAWVNEVTRDPDFYSWYDGTIYRSYYNDPTIGGESSAYGCGDGWSGGWGGTDVVYPSMPYMRDKLTSYLQSNIMPVLDERDFATHTHWEDLVTVAKCDYVNTPTYEYYCDQDLDRGPYSSPDCDNACPTSCTQGYRYRFGTQQKYASESKCEQAHGEGFCEQIASIGGYSCNTNSRVYSDYMDCYYGCDDIHDWTPTSIDYTPGAFCTGYGAGASIHVVADTNLLRETSGQGSAYLDNAMERDLISYLGLAPVANGDYGNFDGRAASIVRADFMKSSCTTPPLVGLAIDASDNSLATLVGSAGCDLYNPDASCRGLLHKFFFNGSQMQYTQRVGRGAPDPHPGKFDLLLQEWTPSCPSGIDAEIGARMDLSRALLSNFSKPSLIWRFHFPDNGCKRFNPATGQQDYNQFMEALFNQTGDFVDSGIIGIIYDAWGTESGRGYGPATYDAGGFASYTGLSTTLATGALEGAGSKASTPFCAVQKNSKEVLGVTRFTYGQRIYADDKTCGCVECSKSDYALGLCDQNAAVEPDLPQLYCNDGKTCAMPSGRVDYDKFRCPSNCVNSSACTLCTSFPTTVQSYCRIEQVGEQVQVAYRNYTELDDATAGTDWEFLAGLPAKDKCCVIKNATESIPTMYTYVSKKGTKQRSEFLQYPTRGEEGLDCGRTPDTSVLSYCGITIPVSQKDITCFRSG